MEIKILKIILLLLLMIPTVKALLLGAPWVPTPQKAVKKMLEQASLKTGKKLYDIGCGDGRIVHIAARDYGVEAIGLELSPLIWLMARIKSFFLRSKARILFRDFHKMNLSDADVITCYLMPETNTALKKKLEKELKKGTRIISYAFSFKGWKELKQIPRDRELGLAPIWVYEMGRHELPEGQKDLQSGRKSGFFSRSVK